MTSPTQKNSRQNNEIWKTVVSSASAGGLGAFICFPFEGIKKRIQSGQAISPKIPELYRGALPFSVSVTAATVAMYFFNRKMETLAGYDPNSPTCVLSTVAMSGMLGALVGSAPVENIILTQQLENAGPITALKIMFKQGATRPWTGIGELMFREGGFALSTLWAIEACKKRVLHETNNTYLANASAIGVGAFGATITQPFDVVATFKQKANGKITSETAIQLIYKTIGPAGFFKGLNSRIFLFTGCACLIPPIEKRIKSTLDEVNPS